MEGFTINRPITNKELDNIDIEGAKELGSDLDYLKKAKSLIYSISLKNKVNYCPFLSKSFNENCVWFEIVRTPPQNNLASLIELKIKQFNTLKPTNINKKYKTLILVFPNEFIIPIQKKLDKMPDDLKTFIIKYGIVVGGFSAGDSHRVNYVIIRYLVEADISFLLNTEPVSDRILYLKNYIKKFNATLNKKQLLLVQNKLKEAELRI